MKFKLQVLFKYLRLCTIGSETMDLTASGILIIFVGVEEKLSGKHSTALLIQIALLTSETPLIQFMYVAVTLPKKGPGELNLVY